MEFLVKKEAVKNALIITMKFGALAKDVATKWICEKNGTGNAHNVVVKILIKLKHKKYVKIFKTSFALSSTDRSIKDIEYAIKLNKLEMEDLKENLLYYQNLKIKNKKNANHFRNAAL